ncbi:MAG: hypothetical protein ACW97P_02170, partial [Candidatus Hodarchaeales archaeon]
MADDSTDGIIGIIGAAVFAVLAVVVPFLKLEGFGFITKSEGGLTSDFFWDEVSAGPLAMGYDLYLDLLKLAGGFTGQQPTEIVWTIIPLWGFAFLGLGFLGAILVLVPALQKMMGSEPMGVAFYGFLAGLVGTLVEFALFLVAGLLDGDLMGGGIEDVNFILLGMFVVGW